MHVHRAALFLSADGGSRQTLLGGYWLSAMNCHLLTPQVTVACMCTEEHFLVCRWWQQADSPWQLLAVCYDLQAALSSGDPESYCSKLPVHQDGSCNGLQHYAALGRDEKGGRAVNLLPVDKPQVCFMLWTSCDLGFCLSERHGKVLP